MLAIKEMKKFLIKECQNWYEWALKRLEPKPDKPVSLIVLTAGGVG
jgi:hypothetical protein